MYHQHADATIPYDFPVVGEYHFLIHKGLPIAIPSACMYRFSLNEKRFQFRAAEWHLDMDMEQKIWHDVRQAKISKFI